MSKKPLRVGFDLDGVLLYNPARIVRPFVVLIKKLLTHDSKTTFFIPRTRLHQMFWKFLHYSSLFIAPGLQDIKQLVAERKIEAYIITGRYGFLKADFDKWLDKINKDSTFTKAVINEKNEQPHLFKQKAVGALRLDIFIEDNWDIVKQLRPKVDRPLGEKTAKTFWIYNIFDRGIEYEYKFPTLQKAVNYIKKLVSMNSN